MKVHDAEIESKESVKEAFLQKEPIKVENILYVPECHTPTTPRELDVCRLCRFYRVKGLCKSYFADKVCTACADADIEVNFNTNWGLSNSAIKLHYLQTETL